ncbi:MAG: type II toxin-antitoxin system antitoxin SocA domain-containing protein [Spirulinaceae cyanobacterium]
MIDCLYAAKYFIIRAYQNGIEAEITNMKVQKLLYYAQSLHLALYNEPLFEEEIQAWRYGPVCPPAYKFYSNFEAQQLPLPDEESLLLLPLEKRELLEQVWEHFGSYHAYQLSGMTHLEFPWKKARKGLLSDASSTEPILLEDMEELGHQKLDLIEKDNPVYELAMAELLKDTFNSESSNHISKGEVHDWLNSLLD